MLIDILEIYCQSKGGNVVDTGQGKTMAEPMGEGKLEQV
jgi:hypothetical protein